MKILLKTVEMLHQMLNEEKSWRKKLLFTKHMPCAHQRLGSSWTWYSDSISMFSREGNKNTRLTVPAFLKTFQRCIASHEKRTSLQFLKARYLNSVDAA